MCRSSRMASSTAPYSKHAEAAAKKSPGWCGANDRPRSARERRLARVAVLERRVRGARQEAGGVGVGRSVEAGNEPAQLLARPAHASPRRTGRAARWEKPPRVRRVARTRRGCPAGWASADSDNGGLRFGWTPRGFRDRRQPACVHAPALSARFPRALNAGIAPRHHRPRRRTARACRQFSGNARAREAAPRNRASSAWATSMRYSRSERMSSIGAMSPLQRRAASARPRRDRAASPRSARLGAARAHRASARRCPTRGGRGSRCRRAPRRMHAGEHDLRDALRRARAHLAEELDDALRGAAAASPTTISSSGSSASVR